MKFKKRKIAIIWVGVTLFLLVCSNLIFKLTDYISAVKELKTDIHIARVVISKSSEEEDNAMLDKINKAGDKKRQAARQFTFASLFALCYLSIFVCFLYTNKDTN